MKLKERYQKSEAVKELELMFHKAKELKHPKIPTDYLVQTKFRDDGANELTACIMAYLKLNNAFGARINTQGTYSTKLKKYIYSGSTKGMPDISAIVKGRFIGIEVKYNKDKQNDGQKLVQRQIEEAGGLYFIAKDFTSFKQWYEKTLITI